jgi:hypothetical protein
MSRRQRLAIMMALALLGAGAVVGLRAQTPAVPGMDSSFRVLFWERRGLDLLVQVGLMLVGALGIVALLPTARRDGE